MALSNKTLSGSGFVILNIIRGLNIISLLSVIAASIVMMLKLTGSFMTRYFFFDAVTHILTIIASIFLIISELSLFRGYFAKNWPLLSPNHGFVALGFALIVLGVNILGNLNKEATSQEALGLAFWRVVIAAGCLVFIMGNLNILASYIFRDSKLGISARMVRAHGATAPLKSGKTPSLSSSTPAADYASPKRSPLKAFFRQSQRPTLPSYHTNSASSSPMKSKPDIMVDTTGLGTNMPMTISAPLNVNPQFAHLVRPDLAHHPSQRVKDNFI